MTYPHLNPPHQVPNIHQYLPLAKTPLTPPTPSRIAVTREYPPDKIALRIGPRGAGARWAEDEPDPENVLADAEWGTEIPGGFKDFSCTLGRNPQLNWRDLVAFNDAYAYQPGVSKVWEGFLDKAPDVSGEHRSISPVLLGHQAALEDNQAAQFGGISAEIGSWGDPSTARRKDMVSGSFSGAGPNQLCVEINQGQSDAKNLYGAGVIFTLGSVNTARTPVGESWLYADGLDIGSILFDERELRGFGEDVNFEFHIILSTDDIATKVQASNNYPQVTKLQQILDANGAGYKHAIMQMVYKLSLGTNDYTNTMAFLNVKVLGRHGLKPTGTWPNVGLTAKQMLEYVIPNLASPLTVDSEYLDDDGFIIPHAWYGEPGPVSDIVKDIVKYGLYDWFVYHGKRFELRKPGTYGKFWKAYVGPSNLNEVGLDSQRDWSSVVTVFQDVDGSIKTVGPLGSGCNVESSELEIIDPEHPAVKAGRTRRAVLDLQGIGTPATAIAVGKRFLEEARLLNKSGSATLSGYVMDQYGVFWPAACVKAGDWVSFVDAADKSYRKIINTSYRHIERSNEIDLDAPASGLEALLERLQVGLISLGVN